MSAATYIPLIVAVIAALASIAAAVVATIKASSLQRSAKVLEFHKERIDEIRRARGDLSPKSFDLPPKADNAQIFKVVEAKYDECRALYDKIDYLIAEPDRDRFEAYAELIRDGRAAGIRMMYGRPDADPVDGEKIIEALIGYCMLLDEVIRKELQRSAEILSRGAA